MKSKVNKIRAAAYRRAGGRCEHCGKPVQEESGFMRSSHLDHFWGRAKVMESLENCWILCAWCDHDKTTNSPSNSEWCQRFWSHCTSHGYEEQIECVKTRLQWNAAKGVS